MSALAHDLLALINTQPRSPTLAEIDVIVAKHLPPPADVTPKVLTYAEFEAAAKATGRGRYVEIARYEPPSDSVRIIWSDPIALFVDSTMQRTINGLLPANSMRFYVVRYDEEMDAVMLHPVSSGAIKGLLPGRLKPIWTARNALLGLE